MNAITAPFLHELSPESQQAAADIAAGGGEIPTDLNVLVDMYFLFPYKAKQVGGASLIEQALLSVDLDKQVLLLNRVHWWTPRIMSSILACRRVQVSPPNGSLEKLNCCVRALL